MDSEKVILFVILAEAGIHNPLILRDSRLCGNDVVVKIQAFYEFVTCENHQESALPDPDAFGISLPEKILLLARASFSSLYSFLI